MPDAMVRHPALVPAFDSGMPAGIVSDVMLKRSVESAAMLPYWDLTDTIVDGVEALRLAGETYLPMFTDEHPKEYAYRLKLTKFTNIYRDTLEGLASKPFEDEVALVPDGDKPIPSEIVDFIENVDGSGNNLTIFSSGAFFNGINSALHWIFIDYDKPDPKVVSKADAKRVGLRPYWSHVLARNVLDVQSKMIAGNEVLTYVKILEPGQPDHVRVFERFGDGSVTWTLYQKNDKPGNDGKTYFIPIDSGTIAIGIIPLVPFVTGRRDGRSWRIFPAMRDAADLQIELYQQESGLKFAKTLTAYPMLAGNGIKPPLEADGKTVSKIAVGPNKVLYAPPNPSGGQPGSWAYVEPNAQSLTFLAADVKETINQLRELGRQPLTASASNLTVVTTAVAAGKAKSAVKAWAFGLKDALENALKITAMWMNLNPTVYAPTVSVYTEFDEFMEGKDLDTLNSARDRGDISRETYWDELRRRSVLSPEFNSEVEEKRLLEELPGDGPDMEIDDNTPADA